MKNLKRSLMLVFIAFLILGFAGTGFGQPFFTKDGVKTDQGLKWMPREIVVKFKPGVSGREIAAINSRNRSSLISTSRFSGVKRLRIPRRKTVPAMVEIYKRNPNVEYAEPNYIAHALWVPDDEFYSYQWHLDNADGSGINMESAWDFEFGGHASVIVAVVDTGVAYEDYEEFIDNPGRRRDFWITYQKAPDLAATTFIPGYDFVNDDPHPNDDEGHGTHVTGTIAQSTNNGLGAAGVAFNASIMPVKVLDSSGSGTHTDIADGIYFATDNGAHVINMSLGGASGSETLETAVAYAYERGVTIVCSSGNDGSATTVGFPAAYDAYCIAVGATRYDEAVAAYSNGGASLDLTAPGGDTTVDQNGDGYNDGVLQQTFGSTPTDWGYWFYQGTSMAAPHVSGVAALLIAKGVATTPDAVREALQSTARDRGDAGWDPAYGWGIVDAAAALQYASGPNNPPVADAGGPYAGTEDAAVTFDGSGSYDPDGDPLTYRWDFGDGSTGAGVGPTHTYTAGGEYTVTLVVNDGKTDSTPYTTTAAVDEVNDAPVADAGPDRSALVGQDIVFDGSASYDRDPDGSIVSYSWDFGDGTTASGESVTRAYAAAGTYTVTLTVEDDDGLEAEDTATVTVSEGSASAMHVGEIAMSIKMAGINVNAVATVTVLDAGDAPVAGATVSGQWSGLTRDSDSGVTDADGAISLTSGKLKDPSGIFIFTVNGVVKDGWTYDPEANVETSGTISYP